MLLFIPAILLGSTLDSYIKRKHRKYAIHMRGGKQVGLVPGVLAR